MDSMTIKTAPWMASSEGPSSTTFYGGQFLNSAQARSPEKLAGQFESMFYRILLQDLRESSMNEDLFGGASYKQMQSMYHDELAGLLGNQGHLGIKDLILQEVDSNAANAFSDQGLLKPAPRGV